VLAEPLVKRKNSEILSRFSVRKVVFLGNCGWIDSSVGEDRGKEIQAPKFLAYIVLCLAKLLICNF